MALNPFSVICFSEIEKTDSSHNETEINGKTKRKYRNNIYGGSGKFGGGKITTKLTTQCLPHFVRKVTFLFGFHFFIYIFNALQTFKLRVHLSLYYRLPFNFLSRAWGFFNSVDLPKWLRGPIFRFYSWLFRCDLKEAAVEDLKEYKNLSEFFRRKLKPELRPINSFTCLVSPVDGQILHCGKVESGHLEQVKGMRYTMQDFLGPKPGKWNSQSSSTQPSSTDTLGRPISRVVLDRTYQESIKEQSSGTSLFQCVIYLAPGDYHCFHSPIDWEIHYRRHFPGRLMSVRPSVVSWVRGLFALNERVVYFGKWCFGFFSMTPVGATNVGSIRVYGDEDLRTNVRRKSRHPLTSGDKVYPEGAFEPRKGDLFGEFNLGSTVVLIFEAPSAFSFIERPNGRIRVGEALGRLPWEF